MKYKEMKQVVNLLYDEWNLGKKEAKATGNICAWIYLMEILEESEKLITYKENNKVIGICGYSNYKSKKYRIRKTLYKCIKNILYKNKDIKDLNGLKKYYENYDYLPKELQDYFDGEVSILIVDKNYRGRNIGKKLLYEIFELARKDNMNNLQILTDGACSYKFYEHCGCNKIYETIVVNEEVDKLGNKITDNAYVYEKKLNV